MTGSEESTSFCEQKEAKNFDYVKHLVPIVAAPTGIKVFCFFFSKKKRFLSKQIFLVRENGMNAALFLASIC
jgi:hypothetical protein